MAGVAGLEPVTSAVTGQRSNQLSYTPAKGTVNLENIIFPVKILLGEFCMESFKNPGGRRHGGGGGEPR